MAKSDLGTPATPTTADTVSAASRNWAYARMILLTALAIAVRAYIYPKFISPALGDRSIWNSVASLITTLFVVLTLKMHVRYFESSGTSK
jgi:hypothetical protein